MWKTPTKSAISTAPPSQSQPLTTRSEGPPSSPHQQKVPFPSVIALNPEYSKLYEKIYRSQQKAYQSLIQEQEKQHIQNMKETISFKISESAKQRSFRNKFGKLVPRNQSCRKVFSNTYKSLIGLTKQQDNEEKLRNFLLDHRQAVELQEQARLVEYHLRDQEKTKSKIDYLNRVQLTCRHRRTDPYAKDRSARLFKLGNEMNFQLIKKTAYIRNDKIMSQALTNAKKNPTYCRMKNFSQIQYILNEDNQNLMSTREIPHDVEQERVYNQMRRLFLSLAFCSDSLRTYYDYIREKDFDRLVNVVLPDTEQQRTQKKLSPAVIWSQIQKITKYKQTKVLHFQDFCQILSTLQSDHNYNPLQKQENRKHLQSQIQSQIEQNSSEIKQIIKNTKFEVLVKNIYEQNAHRIVGKLYLQLRDILDIMKVLAIVPKQVVYSKYVYYSLWFKRRKEGFTCQEFVEVQVAVGVDSEAGLAQYLSLFTRDPANADEL